MASYYQQDEQQVRDENILITAAYQNNTTNDETPNYQNEKNFEDDNKHPELLENGPEKVHDEAEASGNDEDPEFSALPLIVRELCDFEDDVQTPILTWRFYVLSAVFTALGAWLTQMGFFRTTYVPYSIYFVQIITLYLGRLLAKGLPSKKIGFGRFVFDLNPGPFSVKEHVAIVLAANTGATNNLGDYVLAPLIVFYKTPMNGFAAIFFMWAAVLMGFSLASFARVFLIENPLTMFPLTLQQVSVFKAMRNSFENESATNRKQMRVFGYGILIFFLWEFLPEYAFPMLSSLSFICWVTSNPTAVFLGSGLGGAGFFNFTLDWSNIGSSAIYYPYWSQVNIFIASVIGAWILVPVGYFTGAWNSDLYPIQSQTLRLRNGSSYPTAKMMTASYGLNTELFNQLGPPMMSAQLRWGYFFSYTAYLGSFVSLVLFQGPLIWKTLKASRSGQALHQDKLTKLIRAYPPVPIVWNLALFFVPFVVLLVLTCLGTLYMPIYTLFIGIAFGMVIVVPMAYIYAISGYQVPVGYFNELFYGQDYYLVSLLNHDYVINAGGSRHPVGSLSYRVISGQCWYEACSMLSDMKLGHYFHIPPRAVLWAQVWGILVGVPVNYATIIWVCNSKGSYLDGTKTDPNGQWTGQTVISLNNQGIAFSLIGPKMLFDDPIYSPMLYGFVLGAALPIVLYGLHRKWPRARFDLWNVPIFATTFENFYGNISNTFLTWFILGSLNHLWLKKYKYEFWKKYAYIAGAAADTGYNLSLLLIFIAFSAAKVTVMPNWWGNNADSVERCFPSTA